MEKGYTKDVEIESMKYKSFKNGVILVSIDYDNDDKVKRIFINYLVDYNEWRGVE